jgi:prepilin-type N-terminal cleavage/methylation domain-containing protein
MRARTYRAFSIAELLIVVAVLGILAAMVLPELKGHTTEAKAAAAANNLHLLRAAIELYAAQHNAVAPGYFNGVVTPWIFSVQITGHTSRDGNAAGQPGPAFPYGPYLEEIPTNSFNHKNSVNVLSDGQDFPDEADGGFGWIYKPQTKQVRLDWPGTDKKGLRYYDY